MNLNVVLRKTTIRNCPLTNKLIILRDRRQLFFRLPFFLFLNNLKQLGDGENRYSHDVKKKYLVFSTLIRDFYCQEFNKFILLSKGQQKELSGINHSNLKLTLLSAIVENVIELHYQLSRTGPFSVFHDAIIPEYLLENCISLNKTVSCVHH